MKSEQRERKKREGDHIIYRQGSRSGSISSSDESELDELEAEYQNEDAPPHDRNVFGQYAKDRKRVEQAKWGKIKRNYGLDPHGRDGRGGGEHGGNSSNAVSGAEASAGGRGAPPPPDSRVG